jgi:ABC-type nitrate/sulfonate/bicarbonate transport system substrate-binding protein/outer membrane protein OmpA-like peptidoglycan-associated protein
MANGKPRVPFYIALLVIIAGLVWLGVSRFGVRGAGEGGTAGSGPQTEAADTGSVTTAKEYTYVAASRLPPAAGASNYKPMVNRTVRIALNVWAGWAPVIYANNGFSAGKVWRTPGGQDFRVELVLIDDPVAMRDAYVSGNVHVGWATLDMLPLFVEQLRRDSRTMPRVFQQVDFSNGGDGIVVRENIRSVADLRGKAIALAQNSPSHYFLLNALIDGGLQPGDVDFRFTQDAFQAAAAFNADRSVSAAVSWAPDIYKLEAVRGNRMLVTTQTANKLIADVWFARADFARDHADIIEGLVRGIFDAMEALKAPEAKQRISQLMAQGYSIPAADALSMLGDAHSTNYAENREFFLNQNNPSNFEHIWNTASFLYRRIGMITGPAVPFDQVMDFSVIRKLGSEARYANQRDEYQVQFVPTTASAVQAESNEILTKTVVVHFAPNSSGLHDTVVTRVAGRDVKKPYDTDVDAVIAEIGRLAGQYGAARIIIEGHTDASMRGMVDPAAVRELSLRRANAVKEGVLRRFRTLQANQFLTNGLGWDRAADTTDLMNHARNRRVEVKVYPLEATH